MASNKNINVDVTANASSAKKELDSLKKELQELLKSGTAADAELTVTTLTAEQQLKKLKKELGALLKIGTATDAELAALTDKIQKLGSVTERSADGMRRTGDAGKSMGGGVSSASGAMGGLIAAAKGLIGVGLVKAFAEITAQSQNLNRMLAGLFGGTKQAAQQFEFTSNWQND